GPQACRWGASSPRTPICCGGHTVTPTKGRAARCVARVRVVVRMGSRGRPAQGPLMQIKKIEVCGFKSFVDRTVVHIDHAVTAVVGPNGCGKSNIVDAIRWAMGEQSARHLRGK